MSKKKYDVTVNITISTTIEDVVAENEEQAETIARNWVGDDYMYYMRDSHMEDCEVVEVSEQGSKGDVMDDEVERLADAYNALTCAQKDEFLRLTGNE